ncbi:hypothetical protein [Puia sp.]|jgi:hypothetical protein|uniref:beta strand repeat-containing protein n=1 Tax=Puia sp. TaxID=2045100 RepID=UPI002F3EF7D4
MKPTLYAVLFLLFTGLSLSTEAQTIYPVTANVSTSSFGSGVICSNCIINISPGVTVTIDNTCSCTTCTFNGGTVLIKAGSNLTLNGVDSFKNMQVIINQSFNQNSNISFYGDTVAFNASMNFANGRTNIDSSRVSVNAALTLSKSTLDKDSLHLNANLTLVNQVDTFSNSNVTVANGVTLSTNKTNFINSSFAFAGNSSMNVSNGMTSTGSDYYLAGTSTISASSTSLSNDNIVMNGSTNSFTTTNGVSLTNTNVTMTSTTSSTFSGSALTATGGSITATNGGAVSITNAINLTNTAVSVTGGSFTGNSLTDSGGSFNAATTTVNITNAINLTDIPVTLANSTLRGNSLTTSGGSITAATSNIPITNSLTLKNTTSAFTSSFVSGNGLLVTGGAFGLNNTSASITNSDNFSGATVTMDGNSSLTGNSSGISGHSTFTMTGTSTFSVTNGININGSSVYLKGNNSITSNSMAIQSGTWFSIGDGTMANTASVSVSGSFSVDGASTMGIASNNNYLQTINNSLKTNIVSCGGGGTQHACTTGYVYGCGTISANHAVPCVVLATANVQLTATPAGAGQVAISFSDEEITTADRYLIQRNTGDDQWSTITTIDAGGYTNGQYRYTDADAPAGSIEYRIERIDPNGKILYSPIATVTVDAANSTVGIHPNPTVGATFYLTTANTAAMVVNVFTMTGQLLYRTEVKGQTQYAIHLPTTTQPGNAVVVQTIGQSATHSFNLLVR